MPEEEVREEQGSTSEPPERLLEEAARDEAAGEARSFLESEQPEETPPSPAARATADLVQRAGGDPARITG